MWFELLHGTSVRTAHPHVEEIESRLLPGETVGLGVLASRCGVRRECASCFRRKALSDFIIAGLRSRLSA